MNVTRTLLTTAVLIASALLVPGTAHATPWADANQARLLRGWNHWNNPSLLSHVHMPDGLAVNLAFRQKRGGPYWLRELYVASPKFKFTETAHPFEHAWDGSYTRLEFEWTGGFRAQVQTAWDEHGLVVLYTPLTLPERPPILVLETGYLWNKSGTLERSGDTILARSESGTVRIGSTSTDSGILLPVTTPYLSFDSTAEIGFYAGQQRDLAAIKALIERRRDENRRLATRFGSLAPVYEAMQSVVAWNVFYDAANERAIASVSRIWNEAWGGYIIFDWDTYFAALMAAVDHKDLAYANAVAISSAVTDRGFVPNVEASFDVKSRDRSQPPVGSLVCRMIYERYREKEFIAAVYPNLLSWNRWWPKARDNRGFLSWGSDPHPGGMNGHSAKGAKWESGMDNSPLFDDAVYNPETHMFELADVGLMSLYIADCRDLAFLARELGHEADAQELEARRNRYGAKLQELWDEESGIYRDLHLDTGRRSTRLAPSNLYPLLAGVPTQAQAERMIQEHYFNPERFHGEWVLPSISRDDPAFADNSYWRGRIWAPMNFLVYLGMRNYDLPQARADLAEKSIRLLLSSWNEHRRIHENYNSVTAVGDDVRNSDPFYSWGGLLGFIGLMEAGHWDRAP